MFWLMAPAPHEVAPPINRLPGVRMEFLATLSDIDSFEADELPTEAEFVASLDAKRGGGKVPELVATEAQLKTFAERNKPQAPPTPTSAAPQPATTTFPPLESGAAR